MKKSACRSLLCGTLVALIAFISDARGQAIDVCSPSDISNALNQLQCRIDGGVVSASAISDTVSTVCDATFTPESCHNCFRRIGFKAALTLKTLVKLKTLPRSAVYDLKVALADAEDEVCSAKEDPFWNDSPDGFGDGGNSSDSTQKAPQSPRRGGRST